MPGKVLVDLPMPWHGLGYPSSRILIPVVLAAVPDELTTAVLDLANQVRPFHDEKESSATLRMPRISPLVKSL